MADEFTRIARLRERFAASAIGEHGVEVGLGDDAAVLAAASAGKSTVVSVDAAVDGVHFSPSFASYEVIGERAFTAALSDLAAMGASPRVALWALTLPEDFGDEALDRLAEGAARAAERCACAIVGGNLAAGPALSITTTVIGEVGRGAAITRAGAQVGDVLYVTGLVGAAALGLLLLQADDRDVRGEPFRVRWQKPVARIAEGCALVGEATAAIDVSDGLLQDLGHLCRASGVGAALETAHLPLGRGFQEIVEVLGRDPIELACNGGEDYELLFTLPPASPVPPFGTRIGTITQAAHGLVVLDAGGRPRDLPAGGYRHFA